MPSIGVTVDAFRPMQEQLFAPALARMVHEIDWRTYSNWIRRFPMADMDRWRSFAERYLVARAVHFRVGHEEEDGWKAILDAKMMYHQVARMNMYDGPEKDNDPRVGPTSAPTGTMIKTGGHGVSGALHGNKPWTGHTMVPQVGAPPPSPTPPSWIHGIFHHRRTGRV